MCKHVHVKSNTISLTETTFISFYLGSSSCVICLWTWPVPFRPSCGHQTGGRASPITTGTHMHPRIHTHAQLHTHSDLWFCLCVQDIVIFGDDDLPGAYVHILLVLCNRCHGDCWNDIQVHRVSRVCLEMFSLCLKLHMQCSQDSCM